LSINDYVLISAAVIGVFLAIIIPLAIRYNSVKNLQLSAKVQSRMGKLQNKFKNEAIKWIKRFLMYNIFFMISYIILIILIYLKILSENLIFYFLIPWVALIVVSVIFGFIIVDVEELKIICSHIDFTTITQEKDYTNDIVTIDGVLGSLSTPMIKEEVEKLIIQLIEEKVKARNFLSKLLEKI
jgi:hypothetical protein